MSNTTRPDHEAPQDGTQANDHYSAHTGQASRKTLVEGQENMSYKDNPKNLRVLAGFLVSFSKTETGEYWELREGNNSIGCGEENTIRLAEEHVSHIHANLNVCKEADTTGWKFQLVDLSATNGTELNGKRLPIYSGVELNNLDTLKIGEYTLMLFVTDKYHHKLVKSEKFRSIRGSEPSADWTRRDWKPHQDATQSDY